MLDSLDYEHLSLRVVKQIVAVDSKALNRAPSSAVRRVRSIISALIICGTYQEDGHIKVPLDASQPSKDAVSYREIARAYHKASRVRSRLEWSGV